jgi:predicted nucleotidyltransferase component of viral defense system
LTGGTALSYYYLHHRFSEDFDFFTQSELDEVFLQRWAQKTAKELNADSLEFQTLQGQLVFYFHFSMEVVKIDFACYPFEHIGKFTMDNNLKISSMEDIGVNKLQALTTRRRGRDYVDLYEIITAGNMLLSDLLKKYRIKFDVHISSEEWAKYFSGILDAIDQPKFLGERKWREIELYFLDLAKEYASTVFS